MDDTLFLKLALEQAKKSVALGGFPAGAVVVKDGKIISEGVSLGFILNDPTSHAETSAIRDACKRLKTSDLKGAVLYGSLECCVMCFCVSYWSGISKIVYAAKKTESMVSKGYYEGKTSNDSINSENNRSIDRAYIKELEDESLAIVAAWEQKTDLIKT